MIENHANLRGIYLIINGLIVGNFDFFGFFHYTNVSDMKKWGLILCHEKPLFIVCNQIDGFISKFEICAVTPQYNFISPRKSENIREGMCVCVGGGGVTCKSAVRCHSLLGVLICTPQSVISYPITTTL